MPCCVVRCQEEPQITKEILPEIKRVGMTGRLNCTVQRQGINKVTTGDIDWFDISHVKVHVN